MNHFSDDEVDEIEGKKENRVNNRSKKIPGQNDRIGSISDDDTVYFFMRILMQKVAKIRQKIEIATKLLEDHS